jgi:exosortase
MTALSPASRNGLAWMVGVALLWLWTWLHLSVEWRLNEDYAFGFAVPFLALFIAWLRLSAQDLKVAGDRSAPNGRWNLLVAGGLLAFLPAELIRQQDPMWRLSGWLLTGSATLVLVGWLGRVGGRPLVRTLMLPVAFTWLALPWPSFVETPITLSLLGLATGVGVDALNWTGVPALRHGNLIELRNGIVGVDRACSGIQSLQASVMLAVFAGEFFRLSFQRRCGLFAGAVGLAIGINILRVIALARIVHHQDLSALENYHDPVGAMATVLLVAVVLMAGWLLEPKRSRETSGRVTGRVPWQLAGKAGYAVLAMAVAIPVGSGLWFRQWTNAANQEQGALWTLKQSDAEAGWRVEPDTFTHAEVKLLRFSAGRAMDVIGPGGERAHVVHLFWRPDAAVPSLAYSHRPDICLPGAGWQEVGTARPSSVTVGGRTIDGALFRFRAEFSEQLVFHASWYGGEPRPAAGPLRSIGDRLGRVALLWTDPGRRSHELLTVFMPVPVDGEDPDARLKQVLQTVLEPES